MQVNNEFNCFKNEIRDDLKDFKKDIVDKFNDFKLTASKDIKASSKILRLEAWVIAILLALLLSLTIKNTIQSNATKNELYYTKRILEKTIMTTRFANMQQSKINAEFRHDSESMRQIDIEIADYKNKMEKDGFIIVETTRGIVIADEK